jgi:seryl-tRNA synthetase
MHIRSPQTVSAQIGKLMKEGDASGAEALKAQVAEANEVADAAEGKQSVLEEEMNALLQRLPNLLDSRVRDGASEEENELVLEWGLEHVKSGDGYLWHDDIASRMGGLDTDGANRIAGARFSVLKGPIARLERALGQWFLDLHTEEHGYTEVSPPLLVTRGALEGTGQLPKFEEDLFKTNHLVRAA